MENMTTTQSPEVKEAIKQRIVEALSIAQKKAENFRQKQSKLEEVHRKFFDEICKKSNNFILEEKDRNEMFNATMFQIKDDGMVNYSNSITIDIIKVEYKQYEIKVKPGVCKAPIQIFIDEDVKYTRRGRAYTNNGWKIQARIRYHDSNKYKTGGSIVKLINEQIEQEENQRKHDEMVNERRKKIKDALSETFPYHLVENIIDNKEYSVEIKQGVKLIVTTTIDNSDGSVSIAPKRTEFTSKTLGNVLRGLEFM